MDQESQAKVARTSRQRAEFYLRKEKPGRAFSHFLVALQLNPSWKPELKHLFASTLCTWGRILESKGRYDDLFTCYEQAIDTFGDNEEVLNNLGAHLFRMGHLNEASNFFHQALDVNRCFLPAHCNLESISNLLVERWHFRMLNDSLRNRSYREAIIKKVKQGFDIVLDIGTGTSILSLFAVEGGAKEVYACDSSTTMISIANKVIEANSPNFRIQLFNKLSNNLTIPEDIPNRVSLVVTETLDAGLLGEHIIQTLVHAWNSLLLPTGIIIPFGATIWVAPIECFDIARRCRLLPNNLHGNHREDSLDLHQINLIALQDEPYDTHDLSRIRGGYRFLSPAKQAMHINFNNCKEMTKFLDGTHDDSQLTIRCTKSGRIDALAAWFELQLDEDLSLSSSPQESESRAECWDQTVFPLQEPLTVTQDQELYMRISCAGGKLTVVVNNPEDLLVPTSSCEDGLTKGQSAVKCTLPPMAKCIENFANLDLHQLDTTLKNKHVIPVSEEILVFLNDESWIKTLNEVAAMLLKTRDTKMNWNILDLSPFPILGLALLKALTKVQTENKKRDQLTCIIKDDKDEEAIRLVAKANNIDNLHVECISEDKFEDCLDSKSSFDIIMVHLVTMRGELKESFINYLPILRKLLKKDGLFLPKHVSMLCSLTNCQWLAEVSRVIDRERVCDYRIPEFINAYQVSEHLDFWLDSTVNTKFSNIVKVLNISTDRLANTVESPLIIKVKIPILKSGSVNAIVYWFKSQLLGDDTEIINSYANHSAILINPECKVTESDSVEMILTCHQGLIHASLQHIEE